MRRKAALLKICKGNRPGTGLKTRHYKGIRLRRGYRGSVGHGDKSRMAFCCRVRKKITRILQGLAGYGLGRDGRKAFAKADGTTRWQRLARIFHGQI
jgi:hypothetical protein